MPIDPSAARPGKLAALRLARYGFSVFPLVPNDKRPLIANWQNLATNDETQVEAWWSAEPEANIGVSTANLLVIDIDPRNGGDATFDSLVRSGGPLGDVFPNTLAAGTQGGGTHIFYHLPPHTIVKGAANKLGPGVDIKSYGGYVVGAGSTIDDRAYRWKQGYGPDKRDFKKAPQWLIDHCNTAKPKSADAGKTVVAEDDTALRLAGDYLRSQAPEADQGERDNTAFTVAAKLYDFGVTRETCQELLSEWNESHCYPPLDSDDIERIAWSAQRNRENAIGAKHPNAPGFEAVEIAPRAESATDKSTDDFGHFTFWRADEGARQALQQIGDPLIKDMLHRGAMSVLIGAPGGGKTFLALDWSYHIATGKEWAGRPVRQGAVVYLAAEAGNMVRARVAALERHYGPLNDTPLYVVPCPADFSHGERDAAAMLRIIRAVEKLANQQVELLVIDTLNRALSGGDENSSKDIGMLIKNVDAIRDRARCHALIIHHPGKDEAKGGRGHSSVLGGTDTEMTVSRHTLHNTKQRDMPCFSNIRFKLKPIVIGTDPEGAPVASCVVGVRKKGEAAEQLPLTKTEMSVIEAIDEAVAEAIKENPELSVNMPFDRSFVQAAIKKKVTTLGTTLGSERTTVVKLLWELCEKGWIEKQSYGQYVRVVW